MRFKSRLTEWAKLETLEPMILLSAGCGDSDNDDAQLSWAYGEQLDGGDDADTLIALAGQNILNGNGGDDELISVRRDNVLDGGAGMDTAVYWANRTEFTIARRADGVVTVTNGMRTDELTGIESIRFDDGTFSVAELLGETNSYRSIDGTNNNLTDFELGSTDEQLIRLSAVEYGDGVSTPGGDNRPGARYVSNELAAQQTTQLNDRNLTDTAWLWGQFLDHDISISEGATPQEAFNIPVPSGDHLFDPGFTGDAEIDLHRTVYDTATGDSTQNPREQINQITAWVDGSNVYGSDTERANALRSFEGGHLQLTDDNLLIFNDAGLPNADGGNPNVDLFLAGDVRANENAALSAMHTLWAREHNRIADGLSAADPYLNDEQLYQQAREIVVAELQVISYSQFLPAILGDGAIDSYSGYDATIDPTIANEFSTAAYRFGHTMLSAELQRLNNDGSVIDAGHLALRNAFFAPQQVVDHGIDSLLRGVTQQAANEIDTMVVDDVRSFLFGPPGAGGFDLASLNIQRGRDHGLADYNQVRSDLGLGAVTNFSEITSDVALQHRLEEVYGTVDNIDLWVGGLAEDHVAGSSMGETFRTIIADQFTRLRDGDRFWYENVLSGEQLHLVESTTLADVIERNTDVTGLQDNVFFLPTA